MLLPPVPEGCLRPVVFETDFPEVPWAAAGSSFLVGLQGRAFALTARHVLRPDGDLSPLCVRSPSGKLFALLDVFYLPLAERPEDNADIAVVELDMSKLSDDLGATEIWPLESDTEVWIPFRETSPLVVLGFPNDHTGFDLDEGEVVEGLVVLNCQYYGPTETRGVHIARVVDPPPLTTLSGFSGAPVFLLRRDIGVPAVWTLAGMAIQGTLDALAIRFIERESLVNMLRAKIHRTRSHRR